MKGGLVCCGFWGGGTKVMFGNAVIYLKGLHKDTFSDFPKSYPFNNNNECCGGNIQSFSITHLLILFFQGEFLLFDNLKLVTEVEFGGFLL